MKNIGLKFVGVLFLALLSLIYVIPWKTLGISLPFDTNEYKLGLDLHGGVELDYTIDFNDLKKRGTSYVEQDVTEGLKSIVEKRVNSLGTAEPTITTASYGGESHIIVQLPTQTFAGESLSEKEVKDRNATFINEAKDTIGKVVRLEFKEQKASITDEDRAARKDLATEALAELGTGEKFTQIAQKIAQNNENVFYMSGSDEKERDLPPPLSFSGFVSIAKIGMTGILNSEGPSSATIGADGKTVIIPGEKGFVIAKITDVKTTEKPATGTGANAKKTTVKSFTYEAIFLSERPSEWMIAKTEDGKVLSESYLTRAGVSFNQGYQPQVDLVFNDEGAKIFAALTKRLIGKPIAIYVGGEQLTAPTVQSVIPDGHAVITGQYTPESAKKLANDINTGIVPAPISLTSERAIDAKIGANALVVIIQAGLIGLVAIIVFLVWFYRVSGLLAGIALILYAIFLLALLKFFGVVLTLAGIAGIILSIGLAIDANILIFERTKEAIRDGSDLTRSTVTGFTKSWTAIWDSHITSLTSAVILYIFGISLIKGFGLALGIGIVLSLFTAMWVSRILILLVAGKMAGKETLFIGLKK